MMTPGLELLAGLNTDDVNWLLDCGQEQQTIASTKIIVEGKKPEALFFLLEGLLGVYSERLDNRLLATVGPGQVLGEISFLDDGVATATIKSIENSLVLAVPFRKIHEKSEADPGFATRLFRSFARVVAQRLRRQAQWLGQTQPESQPGELSLNDEIHEALESFKGLMQHVDQAALKADGVVPAQLREQVKTSFRGFSQMLSTRLSPENGLPDEVLSDIARRLQQEMLPYLLLTHTAERFYAKPRGYAGDFYSIEQIYNREALGTSRIGNLLDECFLDEPAAVAVRNRRALLADEIQKTLREKNRPIRIMSLASGPAREIFDVFESIEDPTKIQATLIDIDLQALAFVEDQLKNKPYRRQIELVNGNLVYLATGRQKLDVLPQDLIYSIGLIDYFNDTWVKTLLNFIYQRLAPAGKTILGNFHPGNGTRGLMDFVLDWRLIHRDENQMNELFRASDFQAPCSEIRFEAEGINLFAMGVRPA